MGTASLQQELTFETLPYGEQKDWLALMNFIQRYNDSGNHDFFPVHQYFKSRKALHTLESLSDTELTPAGKSLITNFNEIVNRVLER